MRDKGFDDMILPVCGVVRYKQCGWLAQHRPLDKKRRYYKYTMYLSFVITFDANEC